MATPVITRPKALSRQALPETATSGEIPGSPPASASSEYMRDVDGAIFKSEGGSCDSGRWLCRKKNHRKYLAKAVAGEDDVRGGADESRITRVLWILGFLPRLRRKWNKRVLQWPPIRLLTFWKDGWRAYLLTPFFDKPGGRVRLALSGRKERKEGRKGMGGKRWVLKISGSSHQWPNPRHRLRLPKHDPVQAFVRGYNNLVLRTC